MKDNSGSTKIQQVAKSEADEKVQMLKNELDESDSDDIDDSDSDDFTLTRNNNGTNTIVDQTTFESVEEEHIINTTVAVDETVLMHTIPQKKQRPRNETQLLP